LGSLWACPLFTTPCQHQPTMKPGGTRPGLDARLILTATTKTPIASCRCCLPPAGGRQLTATVAVTVTVRLHQHVSTRPRPPTVPRPNSLKFCSGLLRRIACASPAVSLNPSSCKVTTVSRRLSSLFPAVNARASFLFLARPGSEKQSF